MIGLLLVALNKEARKGLFSFEIASLDDSQGNDRRGRSSTIADKYQHTMQAANHLIAAVYKTRHLACIGRGITDRIATSKLANPLKPISQAIAHGVPSANHPTNAALRIPLP